MRAVHRASGRLSGSFPARRIFHGPAGASCLSILLLAMNWPGGEMPATAQIAAPLAVGKRLELFVDDYLIAELEGDVRRQLIRPEPKEVVLTCDAPWEGNASAYFTVFQEEERYRMYYRGHDIVPVIFHGGKPGPEHLVYEEHGCYAESREGGRLAVEVLDAAGKLIGRSPPLTGDAVDAAVGWERKPRLQAGVVQLRWHLQDADLYSFRFR